MDTGAILSEVKVKLDQVSEHLGEELKKLRTGRAHPSMLDGLMVEAYGQSMPLKSVASVTTPEAQQLQISPFDPNNLQAIADAIRADQALGLTPADDGRVVRITLPPMTTENRQDMVKVLHQKLEESLVSARGVRHEVLRKLEQAEKDKQIGQDERARAEKQIDEQIAKHKADAEALTHSKEQEILTV